MPRMSHRYRGATPSATLTIPTKGFFGRKRFVDVDAELLDLSIGGALLAVPDTALAREGIRLDLTLGGEHATVGLRHVESDDDGRGRCGVAFRATSRAFDAVVNETIASLITDPKRNEAWRMNG